MLIQQGNKKSKKNLEIVVQLKLFCNFWRTLDIPLKTCEVSLTLTESKNFVLTDIATQAATGTQSENTGRPAENLTNGTFKITDTKWYVPVVTLSTEKDKKFLEQLSARFKRTIKSNKYRSEMND